MLDFGFALDKMVQMGQDIRDIRVELREIKYLLERLAKCLTAQSPRSPENPNPSAK